MRRQRLPPAGRRRVRRRHRRSGPRRHDRRARSGHGSYRRGEVYEPRLDLFARLEREEPALAGEARLLEAAETEGGPKRVVRTDPGRPRARRKRVRLAEVSRPDDQLLVAARRDPLSSCQEPVRASRERAAGVDAHGGERNRSCGTRVYIRPSMPRTPKLVLVLSENWTLTPPRDLRALVRMAVDAEAAGADAVMISEHVVLGAGADAEGRPANPREYALPGNQDPTTPWPSSLVLLAAVAA